MLRNTVTLGEFKALVETIINEKPDFVYPNYYCQCFYQYKEHIGRCLIGEVLFKLGYTDDELNRFDDRGGINALHVLKELGFSEEISDLAYSIQLQQDTGVPWGQIKIITTSEYYRF